LKPITTKKERKEINVAEHGVACLNPSYLGELKSQVKKLIKIKKLGTAQVSIIG
jgi:hypothetical protein